MTVVTIAARRKLAEVVLLEVAIDRALDARRPLELRERPTVDHEDAIEAMLAYADQAATLPLGRSDDGDIATIAYMMGAKAERDRRAAVQSATDAPGSSDGVRKAGCMAVRDLRSAADRCKRSGHKQAHIDFDLLAAGLARIDAALASPSDMAGDETAGVALRPTLPSLDERRT